MNATDLHICKTHSSSSRDDCESEYYCLDVCPEGGYSISTLISWQHFPRSTSSRSECFSDDEAPSSISRTKSETPLKEEKKKSTISSTEYPIRKSITQMNALHYLQIRHVFELLNFLISHLVCNEPNDPVEFLIDLLEKCLKFRDSFGETPELFTPTHLRTAYDAFDPFGRGHITLAQYMEAMRSLGLQNSITPYNREPPVNEEECVEMNQFLFEAQRCLSENLKAMLRIPDLWEENRLLWKKSMQKNKTAAQKKAVLEEEEEEEEVEEEDPLEQAEELPLRKFESSSSNILNTAWIRQPEQHKRYEPEQLFLN